MSTLPVEPPSYATPLVGDGNGQYRIHIVGNSGTGKSTLAARLSKILHIPHIALDEIFWKPNWEQRPRDEFQALILRNMEKNSSRGWIIDGNYQSHIGLLVQEHATDIIWLDPPFMLYFPRVLWRSLLRLCRLAPPCREGCQETFKELFFSRNSILVWSWQGHNRYRTRQHRRMAEIASDQRTPAKMQRIGGWGKQLEEWVRRVARLAKQ